jgi:hypothetical protein
MAPVSVRVKAAIDAWILAKERDQYGNKMGTTYAGGSPCFDERTGEMKDRYEYIVERHKDAPWNEFLSSQEL